MIRGHARGSDIARLDERNAAAQVRMLNSTSTPSHPS